MIGQCDKIWLQMNLNELKKYENLTNIFGKLK